MGNDTALDEAFTYKRNGNMKSNAALGNYTYPDPTQRRPHTPITVAGQTFTYDANGNMLHGLNGKRMGYDGENRPEHVWNGSGIKTSYQYGADGKRLKKIVEDFTGLPKITLYVGPVEVRNYDTAQESVLRQLDPDIREVDGVRSWLHRDPKLRPFRAETFHWKVSATPFTLASVRYITNEAGLRVRRSNSTN